MKFIKYSAETESSTFTNYVPTESWNFCVVSHMVKKVTPESPEEQESLMFESDSFIRVFQKTVKQQKRDNSGKIITTSFENKEVDQPYNLIVSNQEEIVSILQYLESNVINATKKAE